VGRGSGILTTVPVLGRLGGGALAAILGLFPVFAGLGLVETEGGIEPFARVVAILFGGVFVALGGTLTASPLLEAARARGAVTWQDALRLGLRHLRTRPTRASRGAAASVAFAAAAFWLAAFGLLPGWLGDARGLGALVVIEFLVIHGFPFVVTAAVFARHAAGRGRLVARGALGALVLLYAAVAWKAGDGVWGVAGLLYLMAPNVLAFVGAHGGASARLLVTSRWVIKFGLFMLIASMIGDGSLEGPSALWIGAVYFTLLAGVELYRVVEMPGELATGRRIDGSTDRGIV
jgi:hypothetical protein